IGGILYNDDASSIIVQPDYSVTVCDNNDGSGNCSTLAAGSYPALSAQTIGNDKVSYVKVVRTRSEGHIGDPPTYECQWTLDGDLYTSTFCAQDCAQFASDAMYSGVSTQCVAEGTGLTRHEVCKITASQTCPNQADYRRDCQLTRNAYLAKLDKNGNWLWATRVSGGETLAESTDGIALNGSSIYVGGRVFHPEDARSFSFIPKL